MTRQDPISVVDCLLTNLFPTAFINDQSQSMMNPPGQSSPAVRRLLCVEIPPSPLHSSSKSSRVPLPHRPISSELKENTRPSHVLMEDSDSATLKRKLEAAVTTEPPVMPMPKKQKLADATSGQVGIDYCYCHQCGKKREMSSAVQCTFKELKGTSGKVNRCKNKFCQNCLSNRYGEDINTIKASAPAQEGHVNDSYTFKCPKCRDICNCFRCRHKKGLSPTGNLTLIAKKAGVTSVAQALANDPNATGILPRKGQQVEPPAPAKKTSNTAQAKRKTSAQQPKSLPIVKWTRFYTGLSVDDAKSRIQIREFILRFAPIMSNTISKVHLEELANISGPAKSDLDEEEIVPWVSETCIRSMIMGLLGLLDDGEDKQMCKNLKAALKEIRSSGANLNKMWLALVALREQDSAIFNFPDPLPAPSCTTTRSTRSMRASLGSANATHLATSAQLLPIIDYFVELAIASKSVRTEIEEGVKEGKEITKQAREALRKENERWDAEKKTLEESKGTDSAKGDEASRLKQLRNAHKHYIQGIENSLKIVSNSFIPRFSPMGTDDDGRTYWALTPGIHERDAGFTLISRAAEAGKSAKKSKGKKNIMKDEGERSSLKDWSCFIAVWGKKPLADVVPNRSRDIHDKEMDVDSEENDDEAIDKWWAFWRPSDIVSLADWIAIKAGLQTLQAHESLSEDVSSSRESSEDGDDAISASNKAATKELVRNLKEYASLLQWRARPEEE